MNDYELLYMVSEHDEEIFNILVQKYKPLIYKIVKEYANFFKRFGYELEDLMQLGYITLYNVSHKYNVLNHSLFYSYLKKALKNMIITNIRINTSSKKEVLNQAFSYDTKVPNTNVSYIEILADDNEKIIRESDLILFKNSMPATLSNIFELFYNGYSKDEISILLDENIDDVKKGFSIIKQHALT